MRTCQPAKVTQERCRVRVGLRVNALASSLLERDRLSPRTPTQSSQLCAG